MMVKFSRQDAPQKMYYTHSGTHSLNLYAINFSLLEYLISEIFPGIIEPFGSQHHYILFPRDET